MREPLCHLLRDLSGLRRTEPVLPSLRHGLTFSQSPFGASLRPLRQGRSLDSLVRQFSPVGQLPSATWPTTLGYLANWRRLLGQVAEGSRQGGETENKRKS